DLFCRSRGAKSSAQPRQAAGQFRTQRASLQDLSRLIGTGATRPPRLGSSDIVRVWITEAAIARKDGRPALLNRSVDALPVHIAGPERYHRAPGRRGVILRRCGSRGELQKSKNSGQGENAGHGRPPACDALYNTGLGGRHSWPRRVAVRFAVVKYGARRWTTSL